MIFAIVMIVLLSVLGFSLADSVVTAKVEHGSARARVMQMQLAESALDAAMFALESGGTGNLGSPTTPVRLGGGEFWTESSDNGDGTWYVLAIGRYEGRVRALQGVLRESQPVFHHALYAGNSSEDPDYQVGFGGTGTKGDDIDGDVYSGGSILVEGDAEISGAARATDEIVGASGETNVVQPGFDFSEVALSGPDIVDVNAQFVSWGAPVAHAAGGTAMQVPATSPAHIFRLNPDDRTTETGGTVKDDYFLEDPYEPVSVDPDNNGSQPYLLSVDNGSGITRRTYFIDGNLWVHNQASYSFELMSAPTTGTQVTFIVKGSIHLSDSLRLGDLDLDGIGFIALKDPNVADSGNIYIGDPMTGVFKEMQAYLYAENDLFDVNTDATGAKSVRITGSMAAGNHVVIDRDYGGDGSKHSKLHLEGDDRLQNGSLSLPFLDQEGIQKKSWMLQMWLEASVAGN